jgi:hypothetical protein
MATFRVDLPADPRWVHIVQTMTVANAASCLPLDAGELDDMSLVVGEAVLSVSTTPGVTAVTVVSDTTEDTTTIEVVGTGDELDHEADGLDLLDVALHSLTRQHAISRSDREYRISLGFGESASRRLPD